MTEQELLDLTIQERINMLLLELEKTKPKKSSKKHEQLIQAELFIQHLPKEDKELVDGYIDHLFNTLFLEESFLYRKGFLDGIRAMKFVVNL